MKNRLLAGIAAGALATTTVLAAGAPATAKGGEIGGHGSWFYLSDTFSTEANTVYAYGRPDDEVYVGDWDGNGTDTLAIRRGATFHVRNSNTSGPADYTFTYGRTGDTVLVGDWNGDGTDTLAVRRGAEYHVKNSLTGGPADQVVVYGRAADDILVGDWDGDGDDTFAVRRGAEYHVANTIRAGKADQVAVYGRAGDDVYVGDFDGDGQDSFTVRRGAQYFIANTIRAGEADRTIVYGRTTDTTLVGDWNGDGTDSIGVRRTTGPGQPATTRAQQALAALNTIPVTTTLAGGYNRDLFGDWIDADNDELDTRNEILVRDLTGEVLEDRGSQTVVLSGTLNDPYTGKIINFVRGTTTSNAVQIDHIVPVSAAWKLGGNTWSAQQRVDFYNDFDNLLAVDGPTNSSKSDSTLGEWQPPNTRFRCEYTISYVEVTDEYDLAIKPVDVTYARNLLPTC